MVEYENIGELYISKATEYNSSMGLTPKFSGDVCTDCSDGFCGGDCGGDCAPGACSDCDCACYSGE